jgi:hypothetical protein
MEQCDAEGYLFKSIVFSDYTNRCLIVFDYTNWLLEWKYSKVVALSLIVLFLTTRIDVEMEIITKPTVGSNPTFVRKDRLAKS